LRRPQESQPIRQLDPTMNACYALLGIPFQPLARRSSLARLKLPPETAGMAIYGRFRARDLAAKRRERSERLQSVLSAAKGCQL